MSLQALIQLHILLCLTPVWSGYLWVNPAYHTLPERVLQIASAQECVQVASANGSSQGVVLVFVRRARSAAHPSLRSAAAASKPVLLDWPKPLSLPSSAAFLTASSPRAP
jgi:hypothetical protein